MTLSVIFLLSHIMTNPTSFVQVAQPQPPECEKYSSCEEFKCDALPPMRDCALVRDNRDCRREILFGAINDPKCEASKAAQNAMYERTKAICEVQRAAEMESRRQSCLTALQTCQSILKVCSELAK
jgi:hypothetical protein